MSSENTAVEVWLARHGESESNLKGVWQGQGDSPLSLHGRTQAAALGQRLEGVEFDRVVASPLSRAHDTALAVATKVQLEPAFREINVGHWEGMTRGEVAAEFPDEVAALRAGSRDHKVGGGESWNDLSHRVGRALLGLLSSCEAPSRVLVACHGGVIATLVRDLFELENNAQRMSPLRNTSLTGIRFVDGRAELLAFNDDSHLSRSDLRSPPLCTVLCVPYETAEPRLQKGAPHPALQKSTEWLSNSYVERPRPKEVGVALPNENPDVHAVGAELGIPSQRELDLSGGFTPEFISTNALCLVHPPTLARSVSGLLSMSSPRMSSPRLASSRLAPPNVGAITELTQTDTPLLYSYGMLALSPSGHPS